MPEWVGVNASPLIVLAKIGRLDMLRAAGDRLVTTTSVLLEVSQPGFSDPVFAAVKGLSWLEEVPDRRLPHSVAAARLGPGESSLLAWGMEVPGRQLILDDAAARAFARRHGVPVIGTLAVVLQAKTVGMIPNVRAMLEQIRHAGLYVSDQLFETVLRAGGE